MHKNPSKKKKKKKINKNGRGLREIIRFLFIFVFWVCDVKPENLITERRKNS